MNEMDRKSLWLAIILGLIIFISAITFLWSNILNRGKIEIYGPAPFLVEVFDGPQFECSLSPCVLRDKIGEKNIIFAKEGFKTLLEKAEIKLWRTTKLSLKFQIVPYIVKSKDFPETTIKTLEIIFDEKSQMHKLTEKNSSTPIVFFPKKLKNPQIFASDNFALIFDKPHGYKIDLINKTKEPIKDLPDISAGEWSANGDYFLFSSPGNFNYFLLKGDEVLKLSLSEETTKTSWSENKLFFISNSTASLTVGSYDPETNTYEQIHNFPEITDLPDKFLATSNGMSLYLQKDKKNFRIILRKF